jgi:hypothetical protein
MLPQLISCAVTRDNIVEKVTGKINESTINER